MPFPPRGLKAVEHPLQHKFAFAFGLSALNDTGNSVWCPLVKNFKTVINPNTTIVNPHKDSMDIETGAVCAPMSIIDNLTLTMKFSHGITNPTLPVLVQWTPFFCAFGEKYDATDDVSSATVAAVMQLTKDATEEDITAITTNNLPNLGATTSDLLHPLSTVNLAESATTDLNMTADAIMEDTPFNKINFIAMLRHGTNRGALKACLGKTRSMTLDANHPY